MLLKEGHISITHSGGDLFQAISSGIRREWPTRDHSGHWALDMTRRQTVIVGYWCVLLSIYCSTANSTAGTLTHSAPLTHAYSVIGLPESW